MGGISDKKVERKPNLLESDNVIARLEIHDVLADRLDNFCAFMT